MGHQVRQKPANSRCANPTEVRQKGLKDFISKGVRYVYHRASGTRLPDLNYDHPDFVAAYDAAESAHRIRSRGKGLALKVRSVVWPNQTGIKYQPDVAAFTTHMAANFVMKARPGEIMLYHVGDLAHDQATDTALKDRAQYVNLAHALDLVALRRHRVTEGWTEYYGVRTSESLVGCPSHVLRGDITPDEYFALVALNERQSSQSTSRAIRDALAIDDQQAAAMRNAFLDRGWLENGRPPELSPLGMSLLT